MFGKNAGNFHFQYSVRPCQRWSDWKRGNGKRETVDKWHGKTRNWHALLNSAFNKNIWHILPVPLSLKLSIRHFATDVVMLYSLKNNNTNNYIFIAFAFQINSRASVTPHITDLSFSATSIINWATQQNWLDCFFFGFVQRLTYFYSHIFRSCVFYCHAISVPLTLNIAFIWTTRN